MDLGTSARRFLGLGNTRRKSLIRDGIDPPSLSLTQTERNQPIFLNTHPLGIASSEPVIDELTLKMTASWRRKHLATVRARDFIRVCTCGAHVENRIYSIGNGQLVGPLALHLVVYHRDFLTDDDLRLVNSLGQGLEHPVPSEILGPKKV